MKKTVFKSVIILHVLLFFILHTHAQNQWLWSAGGNGNDEALSSAMDAQGNIYTAGYFDLGAKFGNTVLHSYGSGDIFITKQDSTGNYLWAVNAGGTASDRAFSICISNDSSVNICGFFSGNATFGTFNLSAQGSSPDMFIAKLNLSGQFIWAKRFGGNEIEIPYSIASDANNNLLITGEFKDTVQFGTNTFMSAVDPITGLPGYDIFILKLDSAGNVKWAKQGSAKHDDRGLKVCADTHGNSYICGQFSDTLTFNSVYPNNGYNAGFLLKLDSAGNELWLKKIYAAQVLTYGLACVQDTLWMCGDFQGALVLPNSPPLTSANTYHIFIAKLDSSGNVQWDAEDNSSHPISVSSIAVDALHNAYMSGTFNCTFDKYSLLYGTGIFNSVGFRDIFICKYDNSGTRKCERQIGGPGDDYCSSILIAKEDEPILTGSFETNFNLPSTQNIITNLTNFDSTAFGPQQVSNFCNDANYSHYTSIYSNGNKDVFTVKPIDLIRQPYDFFDRTISNCVRDYLIPYINANVDTLIGCDSVLLFVHTQTGEDGVIGPDYQYQWSNGANTNSFYATTTGMYSVHISYLDNCREFSDSVYIIVYAKPTVPVILYTLGNGKNAIPMGNCFEKLIVLLPDTSTLIGTSYPAGYNVYWQTPFGQVNNDSVLAYMTGEYSFTVETPDGSCSNSNCIEVYNFIQIFGNCLPGNFVPQIHFIDSLFDATDTVHVCKGEYFSVVLADSTSWVNGIINNLITFVDWNIIGGFHFEYYLSYPVSFNYHLEQFKADSSSNCTITCVIENPFNGTTLYTITRNFYLDVYPLPPIQTQINGPAFFCPGDTTTLTVSGGANYHFYGPGIVYTSVNNDTIRVTQEGTFSASAYIVDSVTGCHSSDSVSFNLSMKPAPDITLVPANGLICPNDSVLLIGENGSNFAWYGPLGNILSTSQSIYTSVPGLYHYSFIDASGCSLVSEFVEVKAYSTPNLIAIPSPSLCEGGTVLIAVQSSDSSLVQWLSPLNGGALTQTVNQPGIYSCSVTACNIVTSVNITIYQTTSVATITLSGPDTICEGSPLLLSATPGMIFYQWLSGNLSSSNYEVTQAGNYFLQVTGTDGCTDTASVNIRAYPLPPSANSNDTIICAGNSILLSATGNGTLEWFADTLALPIHIGATLQTGSLQNDTTFYVTNTDIHCRSFATPVHVVMHPSSLLPNVTGNTLVCFDDTLQLFTNQITGFNYSWTGPNGFSSNQSFISILQFDSTQAGAYTLQISDNYCTSPVLSFYAGVYPNPKVSIAASGPIGFCPGGSVNLFANQTLSNYLWLPSGITDSTINVQSTGNYQLIGTDLNGCVETSQSITVQQFVPPSIPVVNDTSVCYGDSIVLNALANGTVSWYNLSQQLLFVGNTFNTSSIINITQYIIIQTDSYGCYSLPDTVIVSVKPIPAMPAITGDTAVCEHDTLSLNASGITNAVYSWTGPIGYTSNSSQAYITDINLSQQGIYILNVTADGCTNHFAQPIAVIPLPANPIYTNAPVCEGDSLQLYTTNVAGASYVWQGPFGYSSQQFSNTVQATIFNAGYYHLVVTEDGCSSGFDSLLVQIVQYPVFSLGNDTTICIGSPVTLSVPLGYSSYTWNTGAMTNSIITIDEGIYWLTVANGICAKTDSIAIVTFDCSVYIPNGFTPNNDGINDYFYISYHNARKMHLVILSRWGIVVRDLNGVDARWDGTSESGEPMPGGTYFFTVDVMDYYNKQRLINGYLQLIR